jgi:hypothetical protein
MKILVIEQNCLWNDFQRENRERFRLTELRVLHPDGINKKINKNILTTFSNNKWPDSMSFNNRLSLQRLDGMITAQTKQC